MNCKKVKVFGTNGTTIETNVMPLFFSLVMFGIQIFH
jgi:hypothetical protein